MIQKTERVFNKVIFDVVKCTILQTSELKCNKTHQSVTCQVRSEE